MSKIASSPLTEDRVREIVREELDLFAPKIEEKLVKEIKEPIMDKLDSFITELRSTHEEYNLQVGKISEHSEAIDGLDTRVSTLETRLSAS